jgi:hypothetical protein
MGKMSGAVIIIMKIEKNLYIFYKGKKKDTENRVINTDGSLMPVIINKVVLYRNLEKVRLSYGIDIQDPYFFIKEKPPLGTVIYQGAGYWILWHIWISQSLLNELYKLRMKFRVCD